MWTGPGKTSPGAGSTNCCILGSPQKGDLSGGDFPIGDQPRDVHPAGKILGSEVEAVRPGFVPTGGQPSDPQSADVEDVELDVARASQGETEHP